MTALPKPHPFAGAPLFATDAEIAELLAPIIADDRVALDDYLLSVGVLLDGLDTRLSVVGVDAAKILFSIVVGSLGELLAHHVMTGRVVSLEGALLSQLTDHVAFNYARKLAVLREMDPK